METMETKILKSKQIELWDFLAFPLFLRFRPRVEDMTKTRKRGNNGNGGIVSLGELSISAVFRRFRRFRILDLAENGPYLRHADNRYLRVQHGQILVP